MLAIKVSISNLIVTCPGPPGWAGTRQVKSGRLKPIWIYWSKRQWVAVASAGLCNAYSLRPPTRSPLRATHEFTSHSTHPQSSSLHGAVKAGSLSEIEKRVLPHHYCCRLFQVVTLLRRYRKFLIPNLAQHCPKQLQQH